MKYAVPTDDGKTVGQTFGRAVSFAIFNHDDASLVVLANAGINAEHGAGNGAASFLADREVGIVIAPEVGPKAAGALASAGIKTETATAGTPLRVAIDSIIAANLMQEEEFRRRMKAQPEAS